MKKDHETGKPAGKTGEVPFRLSLDGDRIHILAELRESATRRSGWISKGQPSSSLPLMGISGIRRVSPSPGRRGSEGRGSGKGVLELTLEKTEF